MTAVAAPADRRFRRSHVKPSRRRRGWRALARPLALYGLLALIGGYGAYRGAELVVEGRVLRIDRIVVLGNARLSRGEVLALLNGLQGQSLLWVDLDAWRRRLLASTWVREAALRRSLPSTIEVILSEREPIGIGRLNGEMYLIDDRGAIIDQYGPPYVDLDLPIVDGLLAPASEGGPTVDESRARLASRVLADLRTMPAVGARVSQVNVANAFDATVILSGDAAVIHLGNTEFADRLQSYVELTEALHEQVANIDYVDMRFDDRVYVRPAGKAAGASAAR